MCAHGMHQSSGRAGAEQSEVRSYGALVSQLGKLKEVSELMEAQHVPLKRQT